MLNRSLLVIKDTPVISVITLVLKILFIWSKGWLYAILIIVCYELKMP